MRSDLAAVHQADSGMTVRLLIHPGVNADLAEALYYYDRKLPGLGRAAIGQIIRLLDRVRRYPLAFPRVQANVRRAALAGLNAELLYLSQGDQIILLAVAQVKDRRL